MVMSDGKPDPDVHDTSVPSRTRFCFLIVSRCEGNDAEDQRDLLGSTTALGDRAGYDERWAKAREIGGLRAHKARKLNPLRADGGKQVVHVCRGMDVVRNQVIHPL